jgi:hypothetical protein
MSDDLGPILVRESAELIHGDGRTVVVQLARWGEPRLVSDGGAAYREAFDSIKLADRVAVVDRHNGQTIGHADVSSYRALPEPTIDLHIAETTAGNDTLALIRNGTLDSVSVEFHPRRTDKIVDGVLRRVDALVSGIAFAFRPAHTAPILATREHKENQDMTTDTDTAGAPVAVTPADLDAFGDTLKRDMIEQFSIVGRAEQPDPYSSIRRFRNLAEFAVAAFDDPTLDPRILNRALADQITSANPGVVPPAWLTTVFGIISRGRPTISAFGVENLPPSGMEVDWPYFDGDFSALVGEQLTEKSEITSVVVNVEKGSAPLKTYAGGSDVSMQLVRRSSPSYLQAYQQIMSIGYAATTDAAVIAAAMAAGTASAGTWDPATGTADELLAALFTASVEVEAASGAPAEFAIASTDVYIAIGTLGIGTGGIAPAPYGTQNVAGTADARSLNVNVSGLPVVHDQYAAAGTLLLSNSSVAKFHEDGPMTVQADDVAKLGVDVAVWGMGAFAPVLPAGLRKIGSGAP